MLMPTYSNAVGVCDSSIRLMVSKLNVLKVVYAPQNPVPSSACKLRLSKPERNERNRNPSNNDPLTLINNVPHGNPTEVPRHCVTQTPS